MNGSDIEVNDFKSILDDALKTLDLRCILHKEAALFSRYVYMIKRRMRGHKHLMYMEKVKRGLNRYISLKLEHVYSTVKMLIYSECGTVYFPTKQMLEYLLIRTQGFCKVMYFITAACEDVLPYIKYQIQELFPTGEIIAALALISRIWYCARYFIICGCQWYSKLLPYLNKFELVGQPWLPEEVVFPDDLGKWLQADPTNKEKLLHDIDVKKVCDGIQEETKVADDIGVPISRKEFLKKMYDNKKEENIKSLSSPPEYDILANASVSKSLESAPLSHVATKNELNDPETIENSSDLEGITSCDQVPYFTTEEHDTLDSKSYKDLECNQSTKLKPNVQQSWAEFNNISSPKSSVLHLFMASTSKLCHKAVEDSSVDSMGVKADDHRPSERFRRVRFVDLLSVNGLDRETSTTKTRQTFEEESVDTSNDTEVTESSRKFPSSNSLETISTVPEDCCEDVEMDVLQSSVSKIHEKLVPILKTLPSKSKQEIKSSFGSDFILEPSSETSKSPKKKKYLKSKNASHSENTQEANYVSKFDSIVKVSSGIPEFSKKRKRPQKDTNEPTSSNQIENDCRFELKSILEPSSEIPESSRKKKRHEELKLTSENKLETESDLESCPIVEPYLNASKYSKKKKLKNKQSKEKNVATFEKAPKGPCGLEFFSISPPVVPEFSKKKKKKDKNKPTSEYPQKVNRGLEFNFILGKSPQTPKSAKMKKKDSGNELVTSGYEFNSEFDLEVNSLNPPFEPEHLVMNKKKRKKKKKKLQK